MQKLTKPAIKKILIVGHTDDTGNEALNQQLSEKRARVVGKIFAQNGVKTQNIYYQGAGSTKPRADNNSAKGREENRRVEIVELDNTQDVALYASQNTAKTEYFTKQTQKKPSKNLQKTSQTKETSKDSLEFGGKTSKGAALALKDEFGKTQNDGFSLVTKAYASEEVAKFNCVNTRYLEQSSAKSLANDKAIHKTSEFRKGLNGSSWSASLNKHLIGFAPVAVLSDGKIAQNPKLYLYKDYVVGSKARANETLPAKTNAYKGTNGLLYRVYVNDKSSALNCADIVFDNKDASRAKGVLYYGSTDGTLLEKEFELNPIKNKEKK